MKALFLLLALVLGLASDAFAAGSFIPGRSSGGGTNAVSVATNANQFAANPVLTIKSGAAITNANLRGLTQFRGLAGTNDGDGIGLTNGTAGFRLWQDFDAESTLDLSGDLRINGPGTAVFYTGFQLPTGGGAGKVLTSDSSGVGTWSAPTGGSGVDLQTNNNFFTGTNVFWTAPTTFNGPLVYPSGAGLGHLLAANPPGYTIGDGYDSGHLAYVDPLSILTAARTAWTATINGAGFGATNIGRLSVTGPITSASLNITTLSQGFTSLTVAAATAVTVDMGSKLEIYATNNLTFTNWTGIASSNANDAVVYIYAKTNLTVTWPAWKSATLGAYFGTNANAPMLTTLTNGDWYILTASAIRTNVAVALSRF